MWGWRENRRAREFNDLVVMCLCVGLHTGSVIISAVCP